MKHSTTQPNTQQSQAKAKAKKDEKKNAPDILSKLHTLRDDFKGYNLQF